MRSLIPSIPRRAVPSGARRGFTLTELVVALALFGVVAAAMFRALDRQARFHDGITRLLEARSQLAATHDVVAAHLRAASTGAGDLEAFTDTSVVFRAPIAAGVACAMTASTLELAPEVLSAGHRITHVRSTPAPGDSVWLFDEGGTPASWDDGWFGAEIAGVVRMTGTCAGTPYVHPVLDAGQPGVRLTLSGAPAFPAGVGPGSALRVTRRARFAYYRTGTGEFALGYADWNHAAGAWDVIQPLSGAFAPLNRASLSASGVAFAALDSAGSPIAPGTPAPPAARLALATRTVTRGVLRMDGLPRGVRVDSLVASLALRNRP
jgi:prepilin-type N-terminal cleavage/methylation domain-containing protein